MQVPVLNMNIYGPWSDQCGRQLVVHLYFLQIWWLLSAQIQLVNSVPNADAIFPDDIVSPPPLLATRLKQKITKIIVP